MAQPSVRVRHGESDLAAAADIPALHPTGSLLRRDLRCAAALPDAAAAGDVAAGRGFLPDGGRCGLPVSPDAGRRRTAGVHGAGGCWGRCGLFLRLFGMAAAAVEFLGGHGSCFGEDGSFSHTKNAETFQKKPAMREKTLLFCPKMLYNRKNWVHFDISRKGRRIWQGKSAAKRNPVPRQDC